MATSKKPTAVGYGLAIVGVAVATLVSWNGRAYFKGEYASLLYLLVIVASATAAGSGPSILAAVLGFLSWNFFFIEPAGTFSVYDPKEWLALGVFLVVGVLCAILAGRAREAAQVAALREADKLKSALLSSVSHDLRTPLSSIKAAATSLLQMTPTPEAPAQRDLASSISEAADQLNDFIGDLLDLSRIDAGVWKPGSELNDLAEVMGTVLARFGEEANLRIQVELPEDLPPIPLDYVHVAQVLWNLLDNALKYSPAGSPVRVDAASAGGLVTIRVIDEGPGVPASERDLVFEKFHRAQRRAERRVAGSGMGLAICKGIVEAHGGRIWVSGAGGRGASFQFTLPLRRNRHRG